MQNTTQRLTVSLYLSPTPKRLATTLGLYQYLKDSYGEITAFKCLRHAGSPTTFTPRAIVMFSSASCADVLRGVGEITAPNGTKIIVQSRQYWDHRRYLERARNEWTPESGGKEKMWAVRGSGVGSGGWRKVVGEEWRGLTGGVGPGAAETEVGVEVEVEAEATEAAKEHGDNSEEDEDEGGVDKDEGGVDKTEILS